MLTIALNARRIALCLSFVGTHAAIGITPPQERVVTNNRALHLPKIFADGMVVQRNAPVAVWGWAEPSTRVSVTMARHSAASTADAGGQWHVALKPLPAGGPYTIAIVSATDSMTIHDVLVGDVWVASGQSNMEFEVRNARNAPQEVASAHDPQLRQFKVPTSWSFTPEQDVAGGAWTRADSAHVGAFTAVGYFFARDLRRAERVPIGIINTNWGGSAIESWMSREAHQFGDSAWHSLVEAQQSRSARSRTALQQRLGSLSTIDSGMVGGKAVWAEPSLDDSGWATMPVPAYWESNGYEGMDGVAWYRTTFMLSPEELAGGVTLEMPAIDDDDVTWVNGVEVGRTVGYNVPRRYMPSASALRVGANVLVVRVTDNGGGGGINGGVFLRAASTGAARSLAGTWKFKVAVVSFKPDGQQINKVPAVVYNSMIHPLLPYPVKGVVWYQGESNANNMAQALAYRGQFASLIASWRQTWRHGNETMPFLWVQLPNYGPPDAEPPAFAPWATQRESMSAALTLPATGQAVAIDVGEAGNIHPLNKQDVGARLALVARRVAYHESVLTSGPSVRNHAVNGGKIILSFDHVGGGLVSHGAGGTLGAFAVAGSDRNWVWANARIVGSTVEVWSDRVPSPVAVRYAWSNGPVEPNLFNREGLPAAPFRTDRW